MLTIALNWIYILFTIFCMGFAFTVFVEKVLHYRFKRMDSVLMAGLVIATVYAQIFSLFYRVSLAANVCMLVCCFVSIAVFRKQMFSLIKESFHSCSLAKKILILLLFIIWCYFTSRGYLVLDASLYHAQSIRWIEEYGVVKGLGNLNGRFAYNSSVFAVSALYSMVFILGQSLHAVNGLIAYILCLGLLDLGKCFNRKKMILSDYARVAAVYYLTTIWDEILAPSSDYAVMCVIFFIMIKWLTQLEDAEDGDNIAPYALLCVMGAYALTLKLTAGLILMLIIKPAYRLLKEKKWRDIALYLIMGLLAAVPWMARTVIISGWLFYPLASLDLFTVDWKMTNIGMINTDAALIKIWARGANAIGLEASLTEWFPNWFLNTLVTTEKLMVMGDIASCVAVVVLGIWVLVKRDWKRLETMLVLFTLGCCYMFWQLSAPMPRYGYAYVLLLVALTVGYLLQNRAVAKLLYMFLIVYGVYKLYICGKYIASCSKATHYVWQQPYEESPSEYITAFEIEGITFYASTIGWITGYEYFPATSSPTDYERIEFRGEGLEDGFRIK